ncbi:GNAT family N-acetyltransferase [Nonomuraea thailandensis]
MPPDVLTACRALLGGDQVTVSGGPSYLVSPPVRADVAVDVLRSGSAEHVRLVRSLPRPASWEPDEWAELTSGTAGSPWAMVAEDGQVVSICHSARLTPLGAEAGTWTSPAHRGRGYAAATTSAWADQLPGVHLFYSTSADNHSSQRVAQRLRLRPLGWFWHLTA